ncbi:Uncharacterised protein [Actinobacillus pleuropneumoniae]|nr:Uncharacterised protein [Actinobacillus pleuropneumoniae]
MVMEILDPLLQGLQQSLIGVHGYTGRCSQVLCIGGEIRVRDIQHPIRPECRGNDGRQFPMISNGPMILQRINGIIRRAGHFDLEFLQNSACPQGRRLQLLIASFPDLLSIISGQPLLNPKITGQFQMGPVIERIANQARNAFRPGHELGFGACTACNQLFVDAKPAHRPPFVMVTLQP